MLYVYKSFFYCKASFPPAVQYSSVLIIYFYCGRLVGLVRLVVVNLVRLCEVGPPVYIQPPHANTHSVKGALLNAYFGNIHKRNANKCDSECYIVLQSHCTL